MNGHCDRLLHEVEGRGVEQPPVAVLGQERVLASGCYKVAQSSGRHLGGKDQIRHGNLIATLSIADTGCP